MTGNSAGYKRGACAGLALLASLVLAFSARAQVTVDAYRGYFLYGQFGEVCTMCEVVVLCEAGESPPKVGPRAARRGFHAVSLAKAHFLVANGNHLGVVCFQHQAGWTGGPRAYPAGACVSRKERSVVS